MLEPWQWALEVGCAAGLVAALAARAHARRGRIVARQDGARVHVIAKERGGARELELVDPRGAARPMLQSRLAPGGFAGVPISGLAYVDGLHLGALAALESGPLARALVVGGGAMILPRQLVALHEGLVVDVAEVEPAVIEVARLAFGFDADAPRVRMAIGDGRAFLERADDGAYDLVAIDAFGVDSVPRRLASAAFFELCRAKLRPGGALAVNLAGTFDARSARSAGARRVFAGMRAAFGAARAFGVPLPGERPRGAARLRGPRNTVAVAVRDAAPPSPPDLSRAAAALPPIAARVLPALGQVIALAHDDPPSASAHADAHAPFGDPPHDPDEDLPVR